MALFVRDFMSPAIQLVAFEPRSGEVQVRHAADQFTLASALTDARQLNASGYNIYYEVNPGAAGRRSRASDITGLRAVVGDLDSNGTRSVADCATVAASLPLRPTYTIMTGGGVQVVYLLDALTPATAETVRLYEVAGRGLRDKLGGDAVFDLPRMMRMPGFTNHPNEKKRAAGRKPAKAHVLAATGCRYPLGAVVEAFARSSAPLVGEINADLTGGTASESWFERLSPADKDACLTDMLATPNVVALADTSDGDHAPNWRTILAACARSDAPNAYDICRAWAMTSSRFDVRDFDTRFRSYQP